jgi:glycerol uptake facilitator-like aquaporin
MEMQAEGCEFESCHGLGQKNAAFCIGPLVISNPDISITLYTFSTVKRLHVLPKIIAPTVGAVSLNPAKD